jgi:nickel-dependent lactate racemase
VDVVVASPGGHPSDLNLIQSVKALFNHRDAVREGGTFILVAEAAGGVLRGMKEWMSWADRGSLGAAIEANYNLAAHNSLMLQELQERARLVLVSGLPEEEALALGFLPAATLQDAVDRVVAQGARTFRVIPQANATHSGGRRGAIGPRRGRLLEPMRVESRAP